MISERAQARMPAYADIIYDVFSFAGGLNSRSSELFLSRDARFALQKDQCTLLTNMIRTTDGAVTTRPGRVRLNETAVAPASGDAVIRSIFELRRSDGSDKIVINAGNGVFTWNTATEVFDSIGLMPTANTRIKWCQLANLMIGVNGTDAPVSYDGTTFGNLAGYPAVTTQPSDICAHRNRIYTIEGQTLRYSALGAPTDWTTPNDAGTIPIPVTEGQGGSGLIPLWDRLIILCNGQVFQLIGSDPAVYVVSAVNFEHGHVGNPYGYTPAGNDIYYFSTRGVHALSIAFAQSETGDVEYEYVSGEIEPNWQDINASNFTNIVAIPDTTRSLVIFLCNRNGANNTEAFVADYYHLKDGKPTWSHYSNFSFASGCEVSSLSTIKEVLLGGYDGIVYKQTTNETDENASGTQVAIPIQIRYTTDLELPAFTKTWRHIIMFTNAVSGTMNLNASYDFGQAVSSRSFDLAMSGGDPIGTTFTVGVSAIGGVGGFKTTAVSIPGHGRFLSVVLSSSTNRRVTIGGFLILAGLRRVIHGH